MQATSTWEPINPKFRKKNSENQNFFLSNVDRLIEICMGKHVYRKLIWMSHVMPMRGIVCAEGMSISCRLLSSVGNIPGPGDPGIRGFRRKDIHAPSIAT